MSTNTKSFEISLQYEAVTILAIATFVLDIMYSNYLTAFFSGLSVFFLSFIVVCSFIALGFIICSAKYQQTIRNTPVRPTYVVLKTSFNISMLVLIAYIAYTQSWGYVTTIAVLGVVNMLLITGLRFLIKKRLKLKYLMSGVQT